MHPEAVALARWIVTNGAQGECPDWYSAFVAADLLHAPVWEVIERSIWYQDKAHIKAIAEREAQKQLDVLRHKGYL